MDPLAAKRYKCTSRCELNLVRKKQKAAQMWDACATQDFMAAKQRVSS